VLTITQPGASRAVIDWNGFSIGPGHAVQFNNGTGATLNRVTDCDSSIILGALGATGSVYLINPQGVLVGRGGTISTGGRFVASTLDASNSAFMQGGPLTLTGVSHASVVNLGRINSNGADVLLLARDAVVNHGRITAPNGTVEFATGRQILLRDSADSQQVFVQAGSHGTVLNAGAIHAAQVNLEAADGNIYALAGKHDMIRATGTTTRDGHVWLVAAAGSVGQSGTIRAANADGQGGTVDTSAQSLSFGAQSDKPAVVAGQWNISTAGITVEAAAASTLARSLNRGTSVDLETTGASGASGDLAVASDIRWHGSSSLTLAAYGNVVIASNTTVRNRGSGDLTLRGDALALANGGSVSNHGIIDWSHSTGIVSALHDLSGSLDSGTLRSNPAWMATPYSGLQTQITAYELVNSVQDLVSINANLAGNYALGKNIEGAGASISAIGARSGGARQSFSGQFDGMGHTIDQLHSTVATREEPLGLFGTIGKTGVVRNVGITNGNVALLGATLGLLAGVNEGLVTHSYTTGNVDSTGNSFGATLAGGLVGQNNGVIERSWSSANVTADNQSGGLVGVNSGTVTQSYATGTVTGLNIAPGGLVGDNKGIILQSYATGSTSGLGFNAGGLAASDEGSIEQSFATGSVSSYQLNPHEPPIVGGVVGKDSGKIALNVYWDVDTTMQTAGGGSLPASNGLTNAQMSIPSSFVSYDFTPSGLWAMPTAAPHPILRWQLAN
jgi:filamentous hemagglutinin family protein